MGVVWILLLVDVLIYGFLTWYMDSIKPGPFGVAKKWYFLFQVSFEIVDTRKYPLRGYILGVLAHTTAWDRHLGGDETLKLVSV